MARARACSCLHRRSTGFKLIILDECDAMTKDAQFALRRGASPCAVLRLALRYTRCLALARRAVLLSPCLLRGSHLLCVANSALSTPLVCAAVIEKYTRNTRFCLICNYVSKIIPALQSRCTRFRFAPLPRDVALARLRAVADAEGLDAPDDGLQAVQLLSAGDMRRALNTLQATSLSSARCDADAVYACTGQPRPADIEAAAAWLLNEPFATAAHRVAALQAERGLALADIARGLLPYVSRMHVPAAVRIALVEALADIEHRLAYVTQEALQRAALVGAFASARAAIVAAAA